MLMLVLPASVYPVHLCPCITAARVLQWVHCNVECFLGSQGRANIVPVVQPFKVPFDGACTTRGSKQGFPG
jgi:hypothetical protein